MSEFIRHVTKSERIHEMSKFERKCEFGNERIRAKCEDVRLERTHIRSVQA